MPEAPMPAVGDVEAAPHGARGIRQRSAWWSGGSLVVIIATTVATAALAAVDAPGPIRPAVTVLFVLTCPGLSLVRLLGLRDPLAELVLGVATSIALAGLLGGVLLYSGMWSPLGGLAILVVITIAGIVGERLPVRRRDPARRSG
jgi:uncharacterized membrane protein